MSRRRAGSVPMRSSRFGTSKPPGPLDAVKLELAVVLGLVVGVVIVIWRLDLGHWTELGLLAGSGFGLGGWLALRTRRAVGQVRSTDEDA